MLVTIIFPIILLFLSYLIGSFSTAIVVAKCCALPDPRKAGSGNAGATNLLRLGGKKVALITLVGDALKGAIPVFIGQFLHYSPNLIAWFGFTAFLGHLYPLFFGFKGGKGVATALGVVLALYWPLGLLALGIWSGIALLFRYSSIASLSATLSLPFFAFWLNYALFLPLSTMALLIIIKHRSNIMRLLQGQEPKIGLKKIS